MPPLTRTGELIALDVALGAVIRARRRARGQLQADIALLVDSPRPIVSRAESGRHTLTIATLLRYARALECRASDLLREAELLAANHPKARASLSPEGVAS
jgi:transcriptional regulator with XRE-family HTH domain